MKKYLIHLDTFVKEVCKFCRKILFQCRIFFMNEMNFFSVHEDSDSFDYENLRLFPNHITFWDDSKYDENYVVPIFVEDVPNSSVILKPRYPKDLVYANNQDFSLEQIKARKYLQQWVIFFILKKLINFINFSVFDRKNRDHYQQNMEIRFLYNMQSVGYQELEKIDQMQEPKQVHRESDVEEKKQFEFERSQKEEFKRHKKVFETEQQTLKAEEIRMEDERIKISRLEVQKTEAERIEAKKIETDRIEAERMESEFQKQQSLQHVDYFSHRLSSTSDENNFLGQSMTVNTKEAINAIQDFWQSSDESRSELQSPVLPKDQNNGSKLTFDIHMDSSMTQSVLMSAHKHQQSYISSFNDQENNRYQNTYAPSQHNEYISHSPTQNSYQYSMQVNRN